MINWVAPMRVPALVDRLALAWLAAEQLWSAQGRDDSPLRGFCRRRETQTSEQHRQYASEENAVERTGTTD